MMNEQFSISPSGQPWLRFGLLHQRQPVCHCDVLIPVTDFFLVFATLFDDVPEDTRKYTPPTHSTWYRTCVRFSRCYRLEPRSRGTMFHD